MATKEYFVGIVFQGDKQIRVSPKKHNSWGLNRWFRHQPEYNRYSAATISSTLIRCGEYDFRVVKLDA